MKPLYHALSCVVLLTLSLKADTFILKSGIKYDATIISQDEKSYTLSIQITPSIKDERRILKDQVKEIIREAKDAKDYTSLKKLLPTPDQLPLKSYASRIKTAKDFMANHPNSKHLSEAKSILKTLRAEEAVVRSGGLKLAGKLIPAADRETNAYDIDAEILFLEMKKLALQRRYQPSLRKWETLKTNYPHSKAYQENRSFAKRVIRTYAAQLTHLQSSLDKRIEQRETTLKNLSELNRERALTNQKEHDAKYASLIERESKELKTDWLTIDPFNQKAIAHNLSSATKELSALRASLKSTTPLAGPILQNAYSALAKDNLKETQELLQSLKSLKIPEKYLAPIREQLSQKLAKREAEQKAAAELEKQLLAEKAAKKLAEAKAKKNNTQKGKKKTKKSPPTQNN